MLGYYLGNLTTKAGTLRNEARVLFLSCDIAKGDEGDVFMNKLAQTMLVGKGGIIGASTVSNWVLFPRTPFASGAHLGRGGTLKVRRYDKNGNQIGERLAN